ncbi:hypothetical protein HPB50_019071 [Hyalomma asiaticum]|uniref:Uncharacterized protein n=1 Tax=Hyalomma asiaticum TaxID=266040 RepID=A0ACB7TMT9_HYAAI|nr:hypothetical protein HPB50_019071 [Hyalomma asiaticum]
MTKRYNLRDRERHSSEMNGDGAENLQALGVADSDAGGQGSGTSDTASEQQLALLQLQLKIAEAETEKQRLMLESQRLRAREGAEPNDGRESLSLGGRSEEHRRLKFASLLKGVLAPMPNQEALVPMWFEDVEATLDSYDVPPEWWAGLVLPQLSERARGLLCRLKAEERKVYSKLKSSILDGLRLTAAEYKRLFMGSRKGENESWDQFAVRLENYFDYYVQSSKLFGPRSELYRQVRHLQDWLYHVCLKSEKPWAVSSRLRRLRCSTAALTEVFWNQLRASLPKKHRRCAAGTPVTYLDGASLPPNFYELLKMGPKFSLEPRAQKHELLATVHRVAAKAPSEERTRCISEGSSSIIVENLSGDFSSANAAFSVDIEDMFYSIPSCWKLYKN